MRRLKSAGALVRVYSNGARDVAGRVRKKNYPRGAQIRRKDRQRVEGTSAPQRDQAGADADWGVQGPAAARMNAGGGGVPPAG